MCRSRHTYNLAKRRITYVLCMIVDINVCSVYRLWGMGPRHSALVGGNNAVAAITDAHDWTEDITLAQSTPAKVFHEPRDKDDGTKQANDRTPPTPSTRYPHIIKHIPFKVSTIYEFIAYSSWDMRQFSEQSDARTCTAAPQKFRAKEKKIAKLTRKRLPFICIHATEIFEYEQWAYMVGD